MFNKCWRLFVTGLFFTSFGFGGLIVSYIVFPCIWLLSSNQKQSYMRCRKIVSFCFNIFLVVGAWLGILEVVKDKQSLSLPKGGIIAANHPTLIDVILLLANLPTANCIIKQEVTRNPFLSRAASQLGYIVNRFEPGFIDECTRRVLDGEILVIFPEGTRSHNGVPGKFQRGAASIALSAGCQIIPAIISCYPSTLEKGGSWYRIPDTAPKFSLRFSSPFQAIENELQTGNNAESRRELTNSLHAYFKEEVHHDRKRLAGERA